MDKCQLAAGQTLRDAGQAYGYGSPVGNVQLYSAAGFCSRAVRYDPCACLGCPRPALRSGISTANYFLVSWKSRWCSRWHSRYWFRTRSFEFCDSRTPRHTCPVVSYYCGHHCLECAIHAALRWTGKRTLGPELARPCAAHCDLWAFSWHAYVSDAPASNSQARSKCWRDSTFPIIADVRYRLIACCLHYSFSQWCIQSSA